MRRALGGRPRRALLAVALAAIAAVCVVNAEVSTTAAPAPVARPASAILAGSGAGSSAWYCAGVAAAASGDAATLVMTNPGPKAVEGLVETVSAGASGPASSAVTVAPGRELSLPVGLGASTVLLRGGGLGVSEAVADPLGWSLAPCASTTSTSWYFAQASTASGDAMQVALFNPTPTPAVADVSFVSASSGLVVPPAYQGIPVDPGSVVVENVSDHVPNNPAFATVVRTLSGSLVASELDEFGTPGNGGTSLLEGAVAPRTRWAFAQNADGSGGGNVYSIFNPGSRPATVTVSIALAQGQAAPLTVRVPPQSLSSLTTQDQTRIPAGTLFGLTFSSSPGSGIVVARQTSAPGTALPASALTAGEPSESHWLVPPVPPGQSPGNLTVVDLAGRPLHVRVLGFGPGAGGARPTTIDPQSVLVVSPSPQAPVGSSPVEVDASGPVAVEMAVAPAQAPGTGEVPAWPLLASPG